MLHLFLLYYVFLDRTLFSASRFFFFFYSFYPRIFNLEQTIRLIYKENDRYSLSTLLIFLPPIRRNNQINFAANLDQFHSSSSSISLLL